MSDKAVIIVAGGKGTRMKSELPKQYLCLGNRPILMHTVELFYRYDKSMKIVLVLPRTDRVLWNELCKKYHFTIAVTLADGGSSRFESVKNGLAKVDEVQYIAVHDGVRPFVALSVIANCFEMAKNKQAVIPVIPVFETLRSISKGVTVDRSDYCLVQTPQVFSASLLKKAYAQDYNAAFTDDASVVESSGYTVTLVEGNRENIKVTTPFDMKLGELLLDD